MKALMQDLPLTLDVFVRRAEALYQDREVVGVEADGDVRRTVGAVMDRARRLAGALDEWGVDDGTRVATLEWNTLGHLEAYWGVPCSGRVLHTLNARLHDDELRYVIQDADDRVVFVGASLVEQLWRILERGTSVEHVVVIGAEEHELLDYAPPSVQVHAYERALAATTPRELRVADEWQAAMLCYTSGTTGRPKGVLYGHRSCVLHAMALSGVDSFAVSERDVVLPAVPMFHANCWGLVHAAIAAGAGLVLAGRDTTGPNLARLIEQERVTVTAGVPTIWTTALDALSERDMSSLRMIVSGGSALPLALSDEYERKVGLALTHAWGMTETSPVGAINRLAPEPGSSPDASPARDLRSSIGRIVCGMEYRLVDGDGTLVPWDDATRGELQVRGPWVARAYFGDATDAPAWTDDGWFRTGDLAVISERGFVRLVDRLKDVIKSGGEWISSIELESKLVEHPDVVEAAVIGVPDAKWGERPIACVVLAAGSDVSPQAVREWLCPRVASWWVPDAVVVVDEIPKTSVGKFAKSVLRERYASGRDV